MFTNIMRKVYYSFVDRIRLCKKIKPGKKVIGASLFILMHLYCGELKAQDLPEGLYEELPGSAYRLLEQGITQFESNHVEEALRFFNASIRKKRF